MNCLEPDLQVIFLSTSFVMVTIRGKGKVLAFSTVKGKIEVFSSIFLGRLSFNIFLPENLAITKQLMQSFHI